MSDSNDGGANLALICEYCDEPFSDNGVSLKGETYIINVCFKCLLNADKLVRDSKS